MIFDAPQMQTLLKDYEDRPDFMVPEIVFLARSEKLENERIALEELLMEAPEIKQKDWLGRFISIDHEQFRSVWFEIMLFSWLKTIGQVEVEPIIEGNYPDFSLEVSNQKIVVEARALLETQNERNEKKFDDGIFWALKQIERPFVVEVAASRFAGFPDWADFQMQVTSWLDTNPNETFTYQTESTIIVLKTIAFDEKGNNLVTAFTSPGMFRQITSELLKKPLKEKAHQHAKIRRANYPYVIALYLEPWYLSSEEVARAWLGEEVWTVDIEKQEVIESRIDKSGIHFYGSAIRYTTVSGTLVFKSDWSKTEKCSFLKAWYIENPFAKIPLDVRLFPVEGTYEVIEQLPAGFRMAWQGKRNE